MQRRRDRCRVDAETELVDQFVVQQAQHARLLHLPRGVSDVAIGAAVGSLMVVAGFLVFAWIVFRTRFA